MGTRLVQIRRAGAGLPVPGPSTDPTARGVYNGKFENLDLTPGLLYYIHVTITQGGSDYKGIIPVKVPVRAE